MENDKKLTVSEKRTLVKKLRDDGVQTLKYIMRKSQENIRVKTTGPEFKKYISVIISFEIVNNKLVEKQSMIIKDNGDVFYGEKMIDRVILKRHNPEPQLKITKKQAEYLIKWVDKLNENRINRGMNAEAHAKQLAKLQKKQAQVAALNQYAMQLQK